MNLSFLMNSPHFCLNFQMVQSDFLVFLLFRLLLSSSLTFCLCSSCLPFSWNVVMHILVGNLVFIKKIKEKGKNKNKHTFFRRFFVILMHLKLQGSPFFIQFLSCSNLSLRNPQFFHNSLIDSLKFLATVFFNQNIHTVMRRSCVVHILN